MNLMSKINGVIKKIKSNFFPNNQKNKTYVKLSTIYSKIELRQRVFQALDESGIIFLDSEKQSEQDIELKDYLFDSLQILLFLVSLEQEIGYELADNILIRKNIDSINTIVDILFESELKRISIQ